VVRLPEEGPEAELLAKTLKAMAGRAGRHRPGHLGRGRWLGRADVSGESPAQPLRCVSYEPYDTKLARETAAARSAALPVRGAARRGAGRLPERMHVVPPGTGFVPQTFRVHDFLATTVGEGRLESALDSRSAATAPVPEPVRSAIPALLETLRSGAPRRRPSLPSSRGSPAAAARAAIGNVPRWRASRGTASAPLETQAR